MRINNTWRPDYIQAIHEQIGPLEQPYSSPPVKLAVKGTDAMQTLCIVSRINTPTNRQLEQARGIALRAFRLVANQWRIVVADGHGVDAEIARTCLDYDIPLLVCGTSVSPKNGVSRRYYQRVIATGTQAEKALARERYMLGLANRVVYFEEGIRFEQSVELRAHLPAL